MRNTKRLKKQISFDLDTNNLKKYYPRPKESINEDYYKKAYKDIKDFMIKNDFEHRQGSVYVSKQKLSYVNVSSFIESLSGKYFWFSKVVNSLDVTNVGEIYDLMYIFERESNAHLESVIKEEIEEYNGYEKSGYINQQSSEFQEDDWDMEL